MKQNMIDHLNNKNRIDNLILNFNTYYNNLPNNENINNEEKKQIDLNLKRLSNENKFNIKIDKNIIKDILNKNEFKKNYSQGMSYWISNLYIYEYLINKNKNKNKNRDDFTKKLQERFKKNLNVFLEYSTVAKLNNEKYEDFKKRTDFMFSLMYSLLDKEVYFKNYSNKLDKIKMFFDMIYIGPFFLEKGPLYILFNNFIKQGKIDEFKYLMEYIDELIENEEKNKIKLKPINKATFKLYILISFLLKNNIKLENLEKYISNNKGGLVNKFEDLKIEKLKLIVIEAEKYIDKIEEIHGTIQNYLNTINDILNNSKEENLLNYLPYSSIINIKKIEKNKKEKIEKIEKINKIIKDSLLINNKVQIIPKNNNNSNTKNLKKKIIKILKNSPDKKRNEIISIMLNNKNINSLQTHGRYCDKSNRNKIIKNSIEPSRILICKKSKKHFFKKGKKLMSTLSKKDQEKCYNQYCWHKLSMKNKIVHRKKIKNLKKTKKNNNKKNNKK